MCFLEKFNKYFDSIYLLRLYNCCHANEFDMTIILKWIFMPFFVSFSFELIKKANIEMRFKLTFELTSERERERVRVNKTV